MTDHTDIKTLGVITFSGCGKDNQPLFQVNAGVPLAQALEHASNLLYCAKHLALDAAMEPDGQKHAWAAHYLGEMGKAVIDDLSQGLLKTRH